MNQHEIGYKQGSDRVNDKLIEQIDKIKNEMADIGKELRARFDKYKTESEGEGCSMQ